MKRRFHTLDVFTEKPLSGNPLAVVHDCEGLDSEAMQRIAGEFNLSETVFVMAPENPKHQASIRIFTPVHELPFAGHPTVGTAILLNHLNPEACRDEFVLEEQVGLVRCTISEAEGGKVARFALPKVSEKLSWSFDAEELADVLSLQPDDLEAGQAELWDGGVPYMIVPLRSLEAVKRAQAKVEKIKNVEPVINGIPANPYVFCRGGVDADAAFHARMFAASSGIAEDPATGSAVASLSGWIAHHLMADTGEQQFKIEQGYEMGRPSQIFLDLETKDGDTIEAGISGKAIIISEGVIEV